MADRSKKPRKAPRTQAEAGARNLATWKAAHPREANLKHGIAALSKSGYIPPNPEAVRRADRLVRAARKELRTRAEITTRQEILLSTLRTCLVVTFVMSAYFEAHGITLSAGGASRSVVELASRYLASARLALRDLQLDNLPAPVSVEQELADLTEELENAGS